MSYLYKGSKLLVTKAGLTETHTKDNRNFEEGEKHPVR